jgi:hypothetical protein
MKKPEIKKIIEVLEKSNFKIFKTPFDCNLGGIRTNDNESEEFNDWLYCFYYDKSGKIIHEIVPGTTDAGLYYRLNPMNKNGTAIIQHGIQHRGVYQLQDPKKNPKLRGHGGRKAFRQIKPMLYWRDNNKDSKLDFDSKSFLELGFTNGHYMGTLGKKVNKWSAGCWGAVEKEMDKLYNIADKQIENGLGDIYSFSLLHETSF